MSLRLSDLAIGKVYSFSTQAPMVLGSEITYAKLSSIVDADTARLFEPIDQIYAQILPSLPLGTPVDPAASVFYIFTARNGSRIVIADVWIAEPTLTLIESVSVTITLPSASLSDIEPIRQALIAANAPPFTITTR